jgi:AhpD family alkylhydroperoxidase
MGNFDHKGLIQDINESLGPFRKSQSEAMAGFGQLARASMAEGAISAKHKELIALAIGVTQRCSGCVGFHVKALHPARLHPRRAGGDAGRLRVHGRRPGTDGGCRSAGGLGKDGADRLTMSLIADFVVFSTVSYRRMDVCCYLIRSDSGLRLAHCVTACWSAW